jgi:hypothetical protein
MKDHVKLNSVDPVVYRSSGFVRHVRDTGASTSSMRVWQFRHNRETSKRPSNQVAQTLS